MPFICSVPPLTVTVGPLNVVPTLKLFVPPVTFSAAPPVSVRLPVLVPPPPRLTVPAPTVVAVLLLNCPLNARLPLRRSMLPPVLLVKFTLLPSVVAPAPTDFLKIPALLTLVAAPLK